MSMAIFASLKNVIQHIDSFNKFETKYNFLQDFNSASRVEITGTGTSTNPIKETRIYSRYASGTWRQRQTVPWHVAKRRQRIDGPPEAAGKGAWRKPAKN